MSPDEIKTEYVERKDKISELRGAIEVERAYIKVLQMRCKHPDRYATSFMGESGSHCPDCGDSR